MGVTGLMPKLQGIQTAISLNDLRGCTVGIEASSWLYQVLYSCSWELYTSQVTDRYVTLFEEAINLLLDNGVQPVVVFDGEQIPAKADTKEKRMKKKEEAKKKADMAMQQNDLQTAKTAAKQAIEVTDVIENDVMKALHKLGVPFLKAPHEADAQLAYMAQAGIIDYVITEDSDLLVYGAPKVIYKWDKRSGTGCLIEGGNLWMAFDFAFSRDTFIHLCVLSGCDYLSSLSKIGINRAMKFMATVADKDIFEELPHIGTITNVRVDIPSTYVEAFRKAIHVYKHQVVYDFGTDELCPCTPFPPDFTDYGDYAGTLSRDERPMCQNLMEKVWLSPEDVDASRASDLSWVPEDTETTIENTESRYQTRQLGKAFKIENVIDIVEWTVPGLPVLTLPLMLCHSEEGELMAVTIDDEVELPTVGPFHLFCTSSCFILYEGEKCFLLWKWERMGSIDDERDFVVEDSSNSDESSSEEEGDDVVMLLDEEEEEEDNTTTHTAGFKVMGVTVKNVRQDTLLEAKHQMSLGHKVHTVLQPEPTNAHDRNAIQVVVGVGNQINCVGYIAKELTQHVHPAIKRNSIIDVSIQHIRFRAFNPPGYYMRLLITKKGRWHNDVIRKSISAK